VEESLSPAEFGIYHALIIGINDYKQWPRLKFAEKDATEVRQLLVDQYGFAPDRVVTLIGADATREGILRALRRKMESLGENDNLLIYYAGHGQLDVLTNTGYWVPSNATLYDEDTWIAFSNIQTLLSGVGVKAKNILVLTDSCYGGALARSGPTPGHQGPSGESDESYRRYEQRLKSLANKRSRQIIASGGFQQVPDDSFFAQYWKQALENNPYPAMDAELLFFKEVYPKLRLVGQQEPAIARVVSGPEQDGQFVLLRTASIKSTASTTPDTPETGTSGTPVPVPTPAEKSTSRAPASTSSSVPTPAPAPAPKPAPPAPVPQATLIVRSNVTGDTVYIDGDAKGGTQLDLKLNPGRYTVRVEKEGYDPHEEPIELAPGANLTVRAELKIKPVPLPVISFFQTDPAQITLGESSTLNWQAENAQSVDISGIGAVDVSGSKSVAPSKSSTFTITAKNSQGKNVSKQATVRVTVPAPRIVRFDAPTQVTQGEPAELSWETEYTEQVRIGGIPEVLPPNGTKNVAPDKKTTYTLFAQDRRGIRVKQSVTIEVAPKTVVVRPLPIAPVRILPLILPAPAQMSPAHRTVFTNYPRKTTLYWSTVPGAKNYSVEVEFNSGNQWRPLKKQTGPQTTYTFDFVGAQPGRWRVSAVDAAEKKGAVSPWREFRYTR
jgi:hypothetical protein